MHPQDRRNPLLLHAPWQPSPTVPPSTKTCESQAPAPSRPSAGRVPPRPALFPPLSPDGGGEPRPPDSVKDVPPARFTRGIDFAEVAGASADLGAGRLRDATQRETCRLTSPAAAA